MKTLKYEGSGRSYSDCTSDSFYKVLGRHTVREVCDDIVAGSKDKETWGTIEVLVGGDRWSYPKIGYKEGSYYDRRNNCKATYGFSKSISNRIVSSVRSNGGYGLEDFMIEVF